MAKSKKAGSTPSVAVPVRSKDLKKTNGAVAKPTKGANGTKASKHEAKKPVEKEDSDDSEEDSEDASEEDDSDDSEDSAESASDDDSEDDESEEDTKDKKKVKPVATNGKANAKTDDDDSDEPSESADEDAPAAANGVNGKSKINAEDDDEDDDDDDEEENDSNSDSDEGDSDDSASDTKKSDAEMEDVAPSKKRKADEETAEAPAKKNKADSAEKSTTLFVGNLSWNVDDDALYEEFKEFEPVSARIITDKFEQRPRGFGYVDFATIEAAEKAYDAKNGALLQNRDMRLDFSTKRTNDTPTNRGADRAQKFGDVISPESDTLFVGNVAWEVDEEMVNNFFSEVANVKSLRMPTDPETGKFRGLAYVTYYSVEDAKATFEKLNGAELEGRSLRLDYAKPRDNNNAGGRGGGGRGGRGGGRGGGFGRGGGGGGGGGFGGRGGGGGGFGGRGGGGRGGGRGGFNSNRGGSNFQGKKTTF